MSALRLALLRADDDLQGFDCGNEELNRWLIEHAQASQKADLARTYLLLHDAAVVGYVSLTTGSARSQSAPPRYPIPTIVIARLAIDRRHQGQALGSRLLAEALRRAVVASDAAAARLVVVDAIDDRTASFYRRWGFIDLPENPRRLFRKLSDIRRSLESS